MTRKLNNLAREEGFNIVNLIIFNFSTSSPELFSLYGGILFLLLLILAVIFLFLHYFSFQNDRFKWKRRSVKYSKKSRTSSKKITAKIKNHNNNYKKNQQNNKTTNTIEIINKSRTQFSKYFTPRKEFLSPEYAFFYKYWVNQMDLDYAVIMILKLLIFSTQVL